MLVSFKLLRVQQLEGLLNVLPLGYNTLQFQHQETSEATAIHVPFIAKDFYHEHSIFYGMNLTTRNPVFLDRSKLINGNGCVLATSGAGKSFQVKMMAEQILLRYPQDEVLFVDFQQEYGGLVEEFGGQTITISNGTNTFLNPLDLNADYTLSDERNDTPLKAKTEYLQGFIEAIIDEGPLGSVEKSMVDRVTRLAFADLEQNNFVGEQPVLKDFYELMKKQPEKEAQKIARSLERFVAGSLDIFSHQTNVDIQNRLVNFDLSALPGSIQAAGYLVVLDHVMNRLIQNRAKGINTHLMIDEFHILLAHNAGADYVAKLVKIGRKYNAFITVITQNISDVLEREAGRKILGNAEFCLLLKQKPADARLLCDLYDISDGEASFFGADAKRGQGVIIFGKDKIPFYNPVGKETRIYELNNTDRMQILNY